MVYIKLEENMDKFMEKYQNIPKSMKKMFFKSKCRKGKFEIQKIDPIECIILPEVNEKILSKLKILANIRCWKNVCVSENLQENADLINFLEDNFLRKMDGKWLWKHMMDQAVDYVADMKNEFLGNQEISILCNELDEIISEKIKEISVKVKVCNILTNHAKQFQKLEEEIYLTNGIVLNVSNNYKKVLAKSNLVINFDFDKEDLEKCVFTENVYLLNVQKQVKLDKKSFSGTNIVKFGIDMPIKYQNYEESLEGFSSSILYESFIYKRTNYKNIQKELLQDDAKIMYFQDSNSKILKKENLILPKTIDKMTN